MFHLRFPHTFRKEDVMRNFRAKAGLGNGLAAIKYYPIDMYQLRFGSNGKEELEQRIREGVVLNDIAFWHTEGLVESWSKASTAIDYQKKTITKVGGRVISYDILIEGGVPESPNLPPIHIMEGGSNENGEEYAYSYRDSLLGVVPRALHKNVFLLGFTRPTTGGIANMVEMQGLMVHKLLTQPKFMLEMRETIDDRVDEYNRFFYPDQGQLKETPTDHVVHYGLYTHEVAKFIRIDRLKNLWDNIKSWNPRRFILNLRFVLMTANNAHKFRMDGEYQVEGAKKMAWKQFEDFEHQAIVMYINANLFWDLLLGCVFLYMILLKQSAMFGLDYFSTSDDAEVTISAISLSIAQILCFFVGCYFWYTLAPIIANQTLSMPVPMLGLKTGGQPIFMLYTVLYGKQYWLPAWFLGIAFFSVLARQVHIPPVSGRFLFNDTKHKHRYRGFYQKYKALYKTVRKQQKQQGSVKPAGAPRDHLDKIHAD